RANDQLDNLLNQARGDWNIQRREIQELVKPLEETLETLDSQVHDLEQKREGAYQELQAQLGHLGETYHQLQSTTATLVKAFKAPGVRGVWKEVQLRRVVEMAGMMEHVDFNGQAADVARPDMIVHLPNKGILPVDAKTSMQAYLEAMEASDEEVRKKKLDAHSGELRQRIVELGERCYWQQFEHTPELVAMLMPNDACLGVAFERDPELLEFAIQQRVLLTTPLTLLALLKAVAYGWQQHQVLENARQITAQGERLYDRLSSFLNHMNGLGRRLDLAVRDYNKAVGSLQGRVFPSARRLREMGVTSMELPTVAAIESQTGPPASPDLDEEVEDEGSPMERKEGI
ncbi:MAG: DNA recombination protein RmuC, partial [Candidatus Binatia bacterium]